MVRVSAGKWSYGGIHAPLSVLNTLNGTSDNINNDLTAFKSYTGNSTWNEGLLDLTYTGVTRIGHCWSNLTIKVPSCCKDLIGDEFAAITIDLSNVTSMDVYESRSVCKFVNGTNFTGFKSITGVGFNSAMIGSSTKRINLGYFTSERQQNCRTCQDVDASLLCSKVTSLDYLGIHNNSNLKALSVFSSLNCTTLSLWSNSFEEINLPKNSNLAKSMTWLSIAGNKLSSLTGLKYATNLRTLDLSGNLLQNTFSYVEDDSTSSDYRKTVTMKICEYLALLPNLAEVTLTGNSINNVQGLLDAGFTQNEMTFTRTLPGATGTGGTNE